MSRSMDAGLNVKVIPARVNNADYFRVWVGPYTSEAQADRVRSDMARRGVANGVVVSGR
jgi:rare lipoprotein A